jgi:periplasmic protein TonB
MSHSKNWSTDSPWSRLPWTLPTALMIWAMSLWSLAFFMGKPAHHPASPPPIEAQFIEEPLPPPPQEVPLGQPDAPPAPQPLPLEKPKPAPKREVKPKAQITKQRPQPSTNVALPADAAPGPSDAAAGEEHGQEAAEPSANSPTQGSPYGKGTGSMYANGGARAIVQPLPQIPDDLRREAFQSSIMARFHIAADGSAEVELTRPTQNVRLNRILMDSLKKWRFMPAIKNGRPIASTEEILVKIEVK